MGRVGAELELAQGINLLSGAGVHALGNLVDATFGQHEPRIGPTPASTDASGLFHLQ